MSLSYIVLKTALAQFKQSPSELSQDKLEAVTKQARAQLKIQSVVLQSEMARHVSIPDSVLQSSIDEVLARYDDEEAFEQDLLKNGIELDSFKRALERELYVDAVLDRVASQAADVSELDARIYYHFHREKFIVPEKRQIKHILITLNEDYQENKEAAALARIHDIHSQLLAKPKKFGELAMKHSECPTALQGGALGDVASGVLFPELEAVAFKLKKGQISGVVQSEIGFHILKCENITPKQTVGIKQALPKIIAALQEKQRRNCQKNWLAQELKNFNG